MFHVLDHADVVYSGNLSQSTQFVIEHYGQKLDEAILSGIRILYTDPLHSLIEARQTMFGSSNAGLRKPLMDWEDD